MENLWAVHVGSKRKSPQWLRLSSKRPKREAKSTQDQALRKPNISMSGRRRKAGKGGKWKEVEGKSGGPWKSGRDCFKEGEEPTVLSTFEVKQDVNI